MVRRKRQKGLDMRFGQKHNASHSDLGHMKETLRFKPWTPMKVDPGHEGNRSR
jgi:hypothetical protein